MKALFAVLLALAAAVGIGIMTHNEPGYVFVGYGAWSLETTLAVLLVASILLFLVVYLLLRLLAWTTAVPARVRGSSRRRQRLRSKRLFNKALLELAEGRWFRAERLLAHPDVAAENPLTAALMAALAAQQQHADERRDQYLRDAVQAEPGAENAVCLMQAELQYSRRQFEQALANLNRLRETAPRQNRVPRMLAKVLRELGDWRALAELMPEIRRRGLLDEASIEAAELRAWTGLLDTERALDPDSLKRNWDALPKPAREHPQMLAVYAQALQRGGREADAEALVRTALERRWDEGLLKLYGQLQGTDPARQLDQATRWQKQRGDSGAMLLTLGRLAVRRQLWGKARSFFGESIAHEPSAEAHQELGRLLERLNEKDQACEQYRKALALALGQVDVPLTALKREPETSQGEPSQEAGAGPAALAPATPAVTH